jgi:hypothetical protein
VRFALAICAVLSSSAFAWAGDPAAEAAYAEGRRAALAKDWELACRKFRESQALEAAPGTLLNLGNCEENRGRLLVALDAFQAAERMLKPGDDRVAYAKQREATVEKRLARLSVRLDPALPAGATIERDGTVLDGALLGVAIPVDPGEHVIVVRAPGRADARTTLRLGDAESRDVLLAGGAALAPGEGRVEEKPTPSGAPPKKRPPLKTLGYVGLGAGALGLAIGVIGGVMTLEAKSAADAGCGAQGCDANGLDAEKRGKTWSTISTIGFVAGGAAIAAGATLLYLDARSGRLSARATPGGAGLEWQGSF